MIFILSTGRVSGHFLDFIEKELEKFRKKFITINIVIGGLKFKNNYLE